MSDLIAIASSFGYGILSALIPLFNAEVYIAAVAVVATTRTAWAATLALSVGTVVGKLIIFIGSRQGSGRFSIGSADRPVRVARTRLGRWSVRTGETMIAWLNHRHLGPLTVLVSAVIGIPPLFVVTVIAGASKQNLAYFALMVFVGRFIRFAVLVLPIVGATGA